MNPLFSWLRVGFLLLEVSSFLPSCNAFLPTRVLHAPLASLQMARRNDETEQQAREALKSLGSFHQASWKGRATSFGVSPDIAAGILQKKTSPEYQVDVKLSLAKNGDWGISELYSWQNGSEGSTEGSTYVSSRDVSLSKASVDCDAVDSSYSLDVRRTIRMADNDDDDDKETAKAATTSCELPADIIGTEKQIEFAVEHCLAISDDKRVRLWALYGGDNQALIRVVVCDEKRLPEDQSTAAGIGSSASSSSSTLSASDMMDLQGDIDRIVDKIAGQVQGDSNNPNDSTTNDPTTESSPKSDPSSSDDILKRLQDKIESNPSNIKNDDNEKDKGPSLTRYPISLLELTSGVWLGDSIIRDFPMVPGGTTQSPGKGFGDVSSTTSSKASKPILGAWEVGVQKVAREWLWDFGEMVRQSNEAGKALGAAMQPAMGQSMAGQVCENQYSSRRIPKEERMVYIDWNDGNGDNHVGFILGSVSIQVNSMMHSGLKYCSEISSVELLLIMLLTLFSFFLTGAQILNVWEPTKKAVLH